MHLPLVLLPPLLLLLYIQILVKITSRVPTVVKM
jgi:hypothetical protein